MLFKKKFRIVALISGRGSNLGAVIEAIKSRKIKNAEIRLVVSDNPDAYGLVLAQQNNIKSRYIHPGRFKTKLEDEAERIYIDAVQAEKPDLIILAGFMRVLKEGFISAFEGKIINIHPSLLPKYPGLHTHQRALEAHETESGCTVHFVSAVVDGGKRIMQAHVPIRPDDTEETLARRVLEKEHIIFPRVIAMIANGQLDYRTWKDDPLELKD